MTGEDGDGPAISRLEARLDHLQSENERLRKAVQERARYDRPSYPGDRPAQRKAEATWARRIDRITEFSGIPAPYLPLVSGFLIGLAMTGLFTLLAVLLS